ncbi:outer membrane (scaffolding) protein [Paraburkholderia sp. PGU19]|uniref:MipA/OmpV family protein n=1 Tax=Paraburkholderia sp. PGU19 TaxID=2735434 RepID=UPI0015D9EE6B|nr:MipA/OmpV family protein [Paraburkholderia sp. PGU19]BCF99950.1 outer membrane (scaffolding) protein [Paraburkholderia sp. PGU19]
MRNLHVAAALTIGAAMATPSSPAYPAEASLGAQVNVMPKYDGAASYRALPLPVFAYDNGLFFVSGLSAGIRYPIGAGISTGLIAQFDFGRDADDSSHLAGTNDISNTARVGAFVDWRHGKWHASLNALQATHSGYGLKVRLAGDFTALATPKNTVNLTVGATFGNGDYMNTYFGVTEQESLASQSRLAGYSPSAGIKGVDASVIWKHQFNPHWSTAAVLGVSSLVGDAADSPVVEHKAAIFGSVGLAYRF